MNLTIVEIYKMKYAMENSLCLNHFHKGIKWFGEKELDIEKECELIDTIIETNNRINASSRKIKNRINTLFELKYQMKNTVIDNKLQIHIMTSIENCELSILQIEAIEKLRAVEPEEQIQILKSYC